MDMVRAGKFSGGKELIPIVLVVVAEHPQICLELLVNPLGLPVGLRVEGRRGRRLDPEESIQLAHELRDEDCASIVDPLEGKTVQLPHMLVVQSSAAFRRDSSRCRDEVGPLRHRIDHDHDCVEAMRVRELDNEIDAHALPSTFGNREGIEQSDRPSTNDFVSKACLAGSSVGSRA